jgi:NAD+ kinase
MSIDDGPFFKQKSSGIILCTGTGSTSWCYNINKMSLNSMKKIVKISKKKFLYSNQKNFHLKKKHLFKLTMN